MDKPDRERNLAIALLVIVLTGITLVLYWKFPDLFTSQQPGMFGGPQASTSPGTLKELQDAQRTLLSQAKLNFPDIATARETTISGLPSDLQWALTPDAANVRVQSVTYADTRSGFVVTLAAPLPLLGVHAGYFSQLERLSGWEKDTALRKEVFGLLEYHNARWEVRVTIANVNNIRAQVVVQTIQQ